jgi:flagellar export protein FliJ
VKRYDFRLEAVRRVRRLQEEQARADLRRMSLAVTSAEQQLVAMGERYAAVTAARAGGQGPQSTEAFLAGLARHQLAADTVTAARDAVRAAGDELDQARAAWQQAAGRVTALDKLDERLRAEHALAAARQQDAEATEAARSRVPA